MIRTHFSKPQSGKGAVYLLLALAIAGVAYYGLIRNNAPNRPKAEPLPPTGIHATQSKAPSKVELVDPNDEAPLQRSANSLAGRNTPEPRFDAVRRIHGKAIFDLSLPADANPEIVLLASLRPALRDPSILVMPKRVYNEVARSKVAADGSFDLPMAVDRDDFYTRLRIHADGDYIRGGFLEYFPGGPHDPGQGPLTLECQVGAHVTYELVFPSDTSQQDRSKIIGRTFALEGFQPGDTTQPSRIEATVDDAFELALRHVPPGDWLSTLQPAAQPPSLNLHPFAVPKPIGLNPQPGKRLRMSLHLEWAPEISGLVVDEKGHPIATAEVQVSYIYQTKGGGMEKQSFQQTTAGDGAFAFYGLPMNTVALRANLLGRKPATLDAEPLKVLRSSAEKLQLVLEPGHPLFGHVIIPSGVSPEEVAVNYSYTVEGKEGSGSINLEPNAQGRFKVPGFFGAEYQLKAMVAANSKRPEQLVASAQCKARVTSHQAPVQLILTPSPSIRGRVEYGALTDFSQCTVYYGEPSTLANYQGTEIPLQFMGFKQTKVDPADGSFAILNLAPGKLVVLAQCDEGPHLKTSEPYKLDVLDPVSDVLLTIPVGNAVSGFVRDDRGAGIAGARVSVTATRGFGNAPVKALTDETGWFTTETNQPGQYRASAIAEGMVCTKKLHFELAAGEAKTDLSIQMSQGAFLKYVVRDPSDKPIYNEHISIILGDGRTHIISSNGAEKIGDFLKVGPLIPGKVRVQAISMDASANQGFSVSKHIELVAGKTIEVTLHVGQPPLFTVSGTVTSGNQLMVGYRISLSQKSASISRAVTDEAGRFTLNMPEEGAFTLYVTGPTRQMNPNIQEVTLTKDSGPIHVELPSGSIKGVLKKSDKLAGSTNRLYAIPQGARRSLAVAVGWAQVSNGKPFHMRHIPNGTYDLVIFKDFSESGHELLNKPITVTVSNGRATEGVEVKLLE